MIRSSRRRAEAAGVPDQHVRVRKRRRRQAPFRGRHRQAAGGCRGLVYSRFNGPNQEILEDRLAIWEDAEDALVFSSGMAAIAAVMLAGVRPGDTIVHSAPLYAATETLIGKVLGGSAFTGSISRRARGGRRSTR